MMPPTSIDGTDITGATIDGTDVQEITVDGQTVFSATQLFDFEDGTAQGLTINNFDGGSFSVGSETNTPSGSFSANNIDPGSDNVHGNIELPVSSNPFRVIFDVYMENSTNLFQGFGVLGKTNPNTSGFVPTSDFEGVMFWPSSGEDVFLVKDGSTTLTSTSISQPLNAQYKMDFEIDSSKNYTVSVSRGGTTQVSDSGTFSSASFNNPQIVSLSGGGNVGKNLFDNIEII